MRVTRPAVEYLSRFANENVWMLRNIACRRLCAKPLEASAPYLPESTPHASETNAMAAMMPPVMHTARKSPLSTPLSISRAIIMGIAISMITSPVMKIGVKTDAFLYCLTSAKSVFSIKALLRTQTAPVRPAARGAKRACPVFAARPDSEDHTAGAVFVYSSKFSRT